MRTTVTATFLVAALALMPAAAAAQQELPPDRLPTDQVQPAPEDKPDAIGACGSRATTVVDRAPGTAGAGATAPNALAPGGVATTGPEAPKNVEGETQVNLSEVRGTIVHAEGNLVLIKLGDMPATSAPMISGGRPTTTAVVQLPATCSTDMFGDGAGILAIGTAMPNGILDAQSVQPAQ